MAFKIILLTFQRCTHIFRLKLQGSFRRAATVQVGRYHSWVVDRKDFPDCLEVTAVSEEGYIMALRHRTLDVRGVQFHPESVLTPEGKQMLGNWIHHQ